MKRCCVLIMLFLVLSNLNAKKLYLDVGMGMDITKFDFTPVFTSEIIEGKYFIRSNGPNLNARLGYRVNDRFVIVMDYQNFEISEEFSHHIRVNFFWVPTIYDLYDFKSSVESIEYMGLGFLYYPHSQIQLGLTIGKTKSDMKSEKISDDVVSGDPIIWYYSDYLFGGTSLSIAYDIPFKFYGFLVGCHLFHAFNRGYQDDFIEFRPPTPEISSLGLFVKIRY